jgi:hypothetical protein
MADINTPSGTMFQLFKQRMQLSNKDVARVLLSDQASYGGQSPRMRIDERTFLSREVVHAEPRKFSESFFTDFSQSVPKLYVMMSRKNARDGFDERAYQIFSDEAVDDMKTALAKYGQDPALYENTVGRIQEMDLPIANKTLLLMFLFVVSGCLGDCAAAVQKTQDFSMRVSSNAFATSVAYEGEMPEQQFSDVRLGLCRIVGGSLKLPVHALSIEPEGTEIGSMATADNSITDVDATVSRHHLRVYRDEAGDWYAVGLGSTNGTTVVRGEDKSEQVIEAPREERSRGQEPAPVRIYPSDILCLAGSTRFVVLEISGN